jgi:cell division protein FtsQ
MSEKRELSRAEQVRLRRAKQNTQRINQAVERAHRPSTVVTRRPTGIVGSYVSQKHKRQQQVNRRFNIAIGLPDVRLHAPTLPRLQPGWRLASFFLTLILGAAIYLVWTLPYFRVTESQVTGNARLSTAEINAVLAITGQPAFALLPDDLATRLRLNYPELASAEVKVGFPNQVYVSVTERQPVILWQQGEGYTWVDATGVAFRPRGEAPGLIHVVGLATPPAGASALDDPLSPPSYISRELVAAVQLLAPNVPAGTQMIYDGRYGLGWTDSRGWRVFFGSDAKNMALKLRVYQSLVDSLTSRGLFPVFINVVHADAPYYRMEP